MTTVLRALLTLILLEALYFAHVNSKTIEITNDCNTDASDRSSFIWQGFDHSWQRRYLGFMMPHRLATTKGFLSDETHLLCDDGRVLSKGNAIFAMTPGVDGDYAYPEMKFNRIYSNSVQVERNLVEFVFSDQIEGDPPTAETRRISIFNISLQTPNTSHVPILNGFEWKTHCDPSKQIPGNECNSDGFWPISMKMAVTDCIVDSLVLHCTVEFYVKRGWTPSHGGLRPLSYSLDYNVSLSISTMLWTDDSIVSVPFQFTNATTDVKRDRSSTKSISIQGENGYPYAGVVIQSIQFELDSEHDKQGRYIHRLQSQISLDTYENDRANISYTYSCFGGPQDYDSTATFITSGNLIQSTESIFLGDTITTNGSICVTGHDEPTVMDLDCSKIGIPARTEDCEFISIEE